MSVDFIVDNKENANALNNKQRAFVSYYLESGNIRESALKAGYGSDIRSAASQGSRLLKSRKIKAAIAEYYERQESMNRLDVLSKDETILYLCRLANGTDANGDKVPPNVQQRALDSLLKYHGVTEKIEVSGQVDFATLLNTARTRLERFNTIDAE